MGSFRNGGYLLNLKIMKLVVNRCFGDIVDIQNAINKLK